MAKQTAPLLPDEAWNQWYARQLRQNPLKTKGITSMICYTLGNIIAQFGSPKPFELRMLFFMAFWGLTVAGWVGHHWYDMLDTLVEVRGLRGVMIKNALDQMVYVPPSTFSFYVASNLWEGQSLLAALDYGTRELWPSLCATWMVWPLINLLVFGMVPKDWQVVFLSVCGVFWATYLSLDAF